MKDDGRISGIVIDISRFTRPKPPVVQESPDITPEQAAKVKIERESWNACQHKSMEIDPKQRTVKCADCSMWLDPVWCLQELFNYYEKRVDNRLVEIREYEKREREARERQDKRKREPRAHRIERRRETADRAAYNEYQAKVLTARAERQRALIAKLDAEIQSEELPPAPGGTPTP